MIQTKKYVVVLSRNLKETMDIFDALNPIRILHFKSSLTKDYMQTKHMQMQRTNLGIKTIEADLIRYYKGPHNSSL